MLKAYRILAFALFLTVVLAACRKEKEPAYKAQPSQPPQGASSGSDFSIPAFTRGYSDAMVAAHQQAKRVKGSVEVQQLIQVFWAEYERFPESLEELKEKGYDLPEPPPKMAYQYNSKTGEIRIVPKEREP